MKNKYASICLSLLFAFSLMTEASAAVSPGTSCSKAGAKQVYKNKTYTCIKSGNKLIWNKGITFATYDASFAKELLAEAQLKAAQIIADAKLRASQISSPPNCGGNNAKALVSIDGDPSTGVIALIYQNPGICDLTVRAVAEFYCPRGKPGNSTVTSSGTFVLKAGVKLYVSINLPRYFPLVILECAQLTGYTSNTISVADYLHRRSEPTVRVESSKFVGVFNQAEATKKANQYLKSEKARADKIIADAKNPTIIAKAWRAALEAEAAEVLKAKQEAEARAASAGNSSSTSKDSDLDRVDGLGRKCEPGDWCLLGKKGPGGGEVFYDAGSQQSWGRFLEVAPEDWFFAGCSIPSLGCDSLVNLSMSPWCYPIENGGKGDVDVKSFIDKSNLSTVVGAGKVNTEAMLLGCASKTNGAAKVRAYRGGGLSDWYLPSKDELNELCKYAKFQDTGNPTIRCKESRSLKAGFYAAAPYWSSSEYDSSYAFYQSFSNGGIWATSKDYWSIILRPIRAF